MHRLQIFDYEGYANCEHIRSYRPKANCKERILHEAAANLINEAEKPFVIFGQRVILGKAEKEFKAFIGKIG